jgi:hypothetical protein
VEAGRTRQAIASSTSETLAGLLIFGLQNIKSWGKSSDPLWDSGLWEWRWRYFFGGAGACEAIVVMIETNGWLGIRCFISWRYETIYHSFCFKLDLFSNVAIV